MREVPFMIVLTSKDIKALSRFYVK